MSELKNKQVGGAGLVFLSSLFYGTYGVWTRLMGNNFGPFMQGGIKCAIVVPVLLAFGRPKQWQRIQWRRDAKWLVGLLAANFLIAAPLYYATNKIGIGLATLLLYAGILLAMFFFGWLFGKEKYTLGKCVATVLALVGLALVFGPSVHVFKILPLALALVSGIASGFGICVSQNIRYNAAQSTFLTWVAGVTANLPIAIILHQKLPSSFANISWLYLVLFAFSSVVASTLVIRGVKQIEAGVAGIIGLLEVVFGFVFGIIFFNERPALFAYFGAIFIIAAASIPSLQTMSKQRKEIKP